MSKPKLKIYWSRRDFRLTDNPALTNAINSAAALGVPMIGLYILDPGLLDGDSQNIGSARRLFLAQSLGDFVHKFKDFRICINSPKEVFAVLAKNFELEVFANSDIEPYAIEREKLIVEELEQQGGKLNLYKDQLSISPNVVTGMGNLYSVFTPFKKSIWSDFLNLKSLPRINPVTALPDQVDFVLDLQSYGLKTLLIPELIEDTAASIYDLIKRPDILTLDGGLKINVSELMQNLNIAPIEPANLPYVNEEQALEALTNFLQYRILHYKESRDNLSLEASLGTQNSQMSLALKWGLVSVRTVVAKIVSQFGVEAINSNESLSTYVSELIWREFYRYILYHHPLLLEQEFQLKFRQTIAWESGNKALEYFVAWIQGKTGYPIVDACMMEIANTGLMHNRGRMIVASILTKNLGIDWRWGQAYFRLKLLDLDEASNNGGWQWAGSVGVDPKPIRIFNPYLQAENYDKTGTYQLKWLSESQRKYKPLIEHSLARDMAIRRYGLAREQANPNQTPIFDDQIL